MNGHHVNTDAAERVGRTDCVRLLKALADRTCLTVARQLLAGQQSVGKLNRWARVEPSLLSHHLRVLRDAGLVESRRDGKVMQYRLVQSTPRTSAEDAIDLGCCLLVFSPHPGGDRWKERPS